MPKFVVNYGLWRILRWNRVNFVALFVLGVLTGILLMIIGTVLFVKRVSDTWLQGNESTGEKTNRIDGA